MRQMQKKIALIQETAEIRGLFMNVVSHELRNPMTTIYSAVDLLEFYTSQLNSQERTKLFANVRSSIQHMTRMMDCIVFIGKLQHQQVTCHPEPTDILNLCSSILENLELYHSTERVQIIASPECTQQISIDASSLEYVLTNLLSNALKYSDESEKVLLKILIRNHQLHFEVIDKGIGIPADELHSLAQLFNRCSNARHKKGIGIGLYLVTHCVKLLQGTIRVASTPNVGTCFQVMLPILTNENTSTRG